MLTLALSANPRETIKRLDRKIDANRRELQRREKPEKLSWRSWGEAWERQPELSRRERNLFWLRGRFQIQRDDADHRQAMRTARTARVKKAKPCKTCGGSGLARSA